MTTVSSREFHQDTSRAKKATATGPVFITDRGRPAHVLLSIAEYQRLCGEKRNLATSLAMTGLAEIDFDPPRARELTRSVDLS